MTPMPPPPPPAKRPPRISQGTATRQRGQWALELRLPKRRCCHIPYRAHPALPALEIRFIVGRFVHPYPAATYLLAAADVDVAPVPTDAAAAETDVPVDAVLAALPIPTSRGRAPPPKLPTSKGRGAPPPPPGKKKANPEGDPRVPLAHCVPAVHTVIGV